MGKLLYLHDDIDEETIPLSQVPDLPIIGRGSRGQRVAASTIYRWASRGCHGVRLEVIRVGGVLKTTHSAIRRFTIRLAAKAPSRRKRRLTASRPPQQCHGGD
jgi:hypothetical protein